jgi:hypothetical protein
VSRSRIGRALAVLALAAGLALLGAACGGGGSTSASTTDTGSTDTGSTETGSTETETTATTGTTGIEALSKDDYAKAMRTYGGDVGIGLRNVFEATTPEQTKNALADGERKLKRAAARMATLVPPTDVAKDHAKFVQGIRLFARDLGRAGRQFNNGNVSGVTTLAASSSLKMLQTAYDSIVKKGYDLDST